MYSPFRILALVLFFSFFNIPYVIAQTPEAAGIFHGSEQAHLKNDLIELNRDLETLEEQIVFSEQAPLVIFFTITTRNLPDSRFLKIRIDNETVIEQTYDVNEFNALKQGAAHKLYVSALKEGKHTLKASIGDSKAVHSFTKTDARKTLEIRLSRPGKRLELKVKEWE